MKLYEQYKWMVCVHCATYNHALYIKDTLNSFCMQETRFPYVCVVVDDASTDGEQEIIKKYVESEFDLNNHFVFSAEETDDYLMTFAQHNTNKNCFIAFYQLKYNHGSIKKSRRSYYKKWDNEAEFIAMCEGDDYWIHPQKLQKQVDYMESHPECSYLFTDRYIDLIKLGVRNEIRYKKDIYTKRDILRGFIPGLQTVFFRKELLENQEMLSIRGVNGDRLLSYYASLYGEIHCLHEITAVYRATGEGVSTGIPQDTLYRHLVDDTYRFHHNLGVKDFWSYYYLQGRRIGNAKGTNIIAKFRNICKTMGEVDPSFRVYYLPILIFFYIWRRIKEKYGLGDPRIISSNL